VLTQSEIQESNVTNHVEQTRANQVLTQETRNWSSLLKFVSIKNNNNNYSNNYNNSQNSYNLKENDPSQIRKPITSTALENRHEKLKQILVERSNQSKVAANATESIFKNTNLIIDDELASVTSSELDNISSRSDVHSLKLSEKMGQNGMNSRPQSVLIADDNGEKNNQNKESIKTSLATQQLSYREATKSETESFEEKNQSPKISSNRGKSPSTKSFKSTNSKQAKEVDSDNEMVQMDVNTFFSIIAYF
jgi:hypothetical protein